MKLFDRLEKWDDRGFWPWFVLIIIIMVIQFLRGIL